MGAPEGSSVKSDDRRDPALTKWFYGFDSWLVLGAVIPKTIKMSVVPVCMDEEGTTKHNWSAKCQYNVTGWVSMWDCDMLFQ